MLHILASDRSRLKREIGDTLRLALPLIAGQLSAVGMNVVDAMLAGHLGAHTLGAVAVGSSIWVLALVAIIGVMMALPPSVAQLAGADRREAVGPLFRQAMWMALGLGVVLCVMVRQLGPHLVDAIGIDATLRQDTTGFLHGVAWGAPALALYFTGRGLSEGLSLTRPTMYFGALGLLLLLPIGWCLMYGKLGLAPRGAAGSGEATAIVLWLQVVALFAWLRWRPEYRALNLFAQWEAPQWPVIWGLLRVGLPMGVSLFMEASLFVAVALVLGTLGETAVAGHQVALNVSAVMFMVPLGLAMAITVRVGNAVGRDDPSAVRYAGYVGIALTFATQTVSSASMLLFAHGIAGLYTDEPDVATLAAQLLVLAGLFQFPDGIQVAASGALRGLRDTRLPMLITSFSYWGIGMSCGYWLAFKAGLGARGMWMGLIAGLSMAAVLLFSRFHRLARGAHWKRADHHQPSVT
jgi:MATE family multidrug resistance protein